MINSNQKVRSGLEGQTYLPSEINLNPIQSNTKAFRQKNKAKKSTAQKSRAWAQQFSQAKSSDKTVSENSDVENDTANRQRSSMDNSRLS